MLYNTILSFMTNQGHQKDFLKKKKKKVTKRKMCNKKSTKKNVLH